MLTKALASCTLLMSNTFLRVFSESWSKYCFVFTLSFVVLSSSTYLFTVGVQGFCDFI
jgi:hypothetical protein